MAAWWLIVLSWNGREDTLACLASLAALRDADTEVVVVDNGSTDGSVEAVRAAHPEVHLVENGRNLGFAGGNNAGLRHAFEHGGQWAVLVNNDATLAPDAVARLRRPTRSTPCPAPPSGTPPQGCWPARSSSTSRPTASGSPASASGRPSA